MVERCAEWVGEFGDLRLNRLAGLLCELISEKMSICLRKLAGNRNLEVAFGRLMKNEKFSLQKIVRFTGKKTAGIAQGVDHVLVIEDTTEFCFETEHHRNRKGLGYLTSGYQFGFFVHPALVVDAKSGACLGLSNVQFWTREQRGTTKDDAYKKLPIEQKESLRWISVAEKSKEALHRTKMMTIIADRESDIYEAWDRIPDSRTHALIRAQADRRLIGGEMLFETISASKLAGQYSLFLPAITGKRAARTATIAVRFKEVEILKPKGCNDKTAPKSLKLFAVEAREVVPTPKGEAPVHWYLLTTHAIKDFQGAMEIIHWYSQRWLIEQLFRTTKKQGLNLESSQIETGESLMKLAMLALIAATQSLQLVNARDADEIRPYTDVFEQEDLPLLNLLSIKNEGKTIKQKNPNSPYSLKWTAWIIGRLGGWKGYKSERPPGPITMRNGLNEYYAIKKGWQLSQTNMCIP